MRAEQSGRPAPRAGAALRSRLQASRPRGPAGVVWATAGLLGLVLVGVLAWYLFSPRFFYTGTNSVAVRSVVANLERDQRLCVPQVAVPAGTGRVQFAVFSERPSVRARITVRAGGRTSSGVLEGAPIGGRVYDPAPIERTPDEPRSVTGRVCIEPLDGPVAIGGMGDLQGDQVAARVDGTPLPSRVALWFLPPDGERRSLISAAGDIFERAALFRPGVVGPWVYPVLLFLVLPLAGLAAVWLMARAAAGRGTRVRAGLIVALIAFANAGSWALITPSFNAPDEPDHFAYAQHLAETGKQPAQQQSAAGAYSADATIALDGLRIFSYVGIGDGRPPWLPQDEQRWKERRAEIPHPGDDGGGVTTAAAPHHPTYYGLLAPAYLATKSQSPFSQLALMRLVSALLGALVAACAYGIVRELFPRQQLAAAGAGLLVAFHPMFTFMAGAVSNDNGINAAAALGLYLLIRALRRGPSWRLMLALGATVAAIPLMKGTGLSLYPVFAVGLLGLLWRYHRRADLPGWAALAGTAVALRGVWGLVSDGFRQPVSAGGGAGIDAGSAVSLALDQPRGYVSYLWQVFLPKLSFMQDYWIQRWPFYDIYVLRGWGAFGWYAVVFARWVYLVIAVAMGVAGLLLLAAVVRERVAAWKVNVELVVIALVPICVIAAVEAAYFNPGDPRPVPAEQGRYAFPAMAALAVAAIGSSFGLGRRWHAPLATVLVVAMIGFGYAARWVALAGFYT